MDHRLESGMTQGCLRESGSSQLEDDIHVHAEVYTAFLDQAYPLMPQLITPYKDSIMTEQQADFNILMSELRISAKWGYQKKTFSSSLLLILNRI